MPSAPPSSLLVWAMPDATPARWSGAAPTISSVPRNIRGLMPMTMTLDAATIV
jgi:hypothetical protein